MIKTNSFIYYWFWLNYIKNMWGMPFNIEHRSHQQIMFEFPWISGYFSHLSSTYGLLFLINWSLINSIFYYTPYKKIYSTLNDLGRVKNKGILLYILYLILGVIIMPIIKILYFDFYTDHIAQNMSPS